MAGSRVPKRHDEFLTFAARGRRPLTSHSFPGNERHQRTRISQVPFLWDLRMAFMLQMLGYRDIGMSVGGSP